MTPTREQFKEFIAAVKKAQQKEEIINKALKLIWDDDQHQYSPFYISPFLDAIYKVDYDKEKRNKLLKLPCKYLPI